MQTIELNEVNNLSANTEVDTTECIVLIFPTKLLNTIASFHIYYITFVPYIL